MVKIEIWQLKKDSPLDLYFAPWRWVEKFKLDVKKSNYHKVWETILDKDTYTERDFDDLFMKLQGIKPKDYYGHSLSVSDLIIANDDVFYIDSFGFKQIYI